MYFMKKRVGLLFLMFVLISCSNGQIKNNKNLVNNNTEVKVEEVNEKRNKIKTEKDKFDKDAYSIILTTDKESYIEWELIIVTLNIKNNKSKKICAILPKEITWWENEFKIWIVWSFPIDKNIKKSKKTSFLTIFEPGEIKQFISYNITEIYWILKADKYEILWNYRRDSLDYDKLYAEAKKEQCQPIQPSRINMSGVVIEVQSYNQDFTIKKHISNWKNWWQKDIYELSWIENNVLKNDMTKDEVLNILWESNSKYNNNNWFYSIGFIIKFEQNKVVSFSKYIE